MKRQQKSRKFQFLQVEKVIEHPYWTSLLNEMQNSWLAKLACDANTTKLKSWCYYSNVKNKQQEQHLPVQRPQLASKKASQCIHTLIYPFIGPATNQRLENGLSHLRAMECLNVHTILLQVVALLFMQTSIYSQLASITNEFHHGAANRIDRTSPIAVIPSSLSMAQSIIWRFSFLSFSFAKVAVQLLAELTEMLALMK